MTGGLLAVWLRTLLVQASWNYDRLVGIGVGYASEPLMRQLPGGPSGERYRRAMGRACGYFNAHPYLTGLAIGAMARAEHDGAPERQVERLRQALTGPLGAVGDQLIWAGLLPVASAIGLVVLAVVSPLAGVVAFLGVYNVGHLVVRSWAVRAGWKGGLQVAGQLRSPLIQWGIRLGGPVAGVAMGAAIPVVVTWVLREAGPGTPATLLLGVAVVGVAGVLLARWIWPSLGTLRFGLAILAVAWLAGWL